MMPTIPRLLAVIPLALASLALGAPAHAADSGDEAMVSVLHAIPGATVDVYANGEPLLTDFEPGTLTDPVALPAGSYDLKVTEAGAGADADAVVEASGVEVPGGANITVTANLDADGNPALNPFVNDTSPVAAGQARLTVRHVAAAPAVDVRAGGTPVFSGLTNPDEDTTEVPAGTVSADVVLAGTETVAIGPADLDLGEGTNTIVYAWGSAADDNLQLAVQTISGMHSAPGGVAAGSGGQAAALGDGAGQGWWIAAGALVAGSLALVVVRPRRSAARR